MIKKAYSLLLAVFFAGMICAEENGSAGMSVSAEVSADAQASSAPSFGNDGIDRMAPDFVTVSLVLTGPEDAIYSVAGHACLRLECPTFQHDYCFTYESEDVEDKVLSFFTGNLKMGMFRVPTDLFLKVNGGGRGVWAYKLQLPPDAELRLWQVLDNLVTQEATLPYDYIRRGCAKSVLDCLQRAILPYQLEYPPFPDKYRLSRREILEAGIENHPWTMLALHCIIGSVGDRSIAPIEKVFMPNDLCDFLKTCTINGVAVIQDGKIELMPNALPPARSGWFTPTVVASLLLAVSLFNVFFNSHMIDWFFLALQSVFGLFFTYLVVISRLPGTEWNWLILPFNLLPLLFWKYRMRWALFFSGVLVVWEVVVLLVPHRLTDPAILILVPAYIFLYLKQAPCVCARQKGITQ